MLSAWEIASTLPSRQMEQRPTKSCRQRQIPIVRFLLRILIPPSRTGTYFVAQNMDSLPHVRSPATYLSTAVPTSMCSCKP